MSLSDFNLFLECVNGYEYFIRPTQRIKVKDINIVPEDETMFLDDYSF